ncbi:hypothetical protein VBSAUS321C_19 [Staphylococcus phage vB_SauS_321c]|nr:hypothetical protein VBSAUS321C_19 [Staphylococcus phage vB_SauS_321c]
MRKQKQRENNRKLLNGHVTSRDSHATEEDKELDKELERDKEKDIDKNLSSNNSATDVTHEQFEEWWKLYNKKKDKKMSFTKFKSCVKKHTFEQIMQGTRELLLKNTRMVTSIKMVASVKFMRNISETSNGR